MSWLDGTPRNRVVPERHFLDIGVEHGNGSLQYDPNGAVHAAATLQLLHLAPRPGAVSVLSGHPAVTLRDTDLVVDLTPHELTRLLCRNLMPEEYFALVGRFGMHYNWHGDFYQSSTGTPRNPVFREGEHEYAEIMKGEAAPPDAAWPRHPDLQTMTEAQLRMAMVQHPAVVTGYWQVHDEQGCLVSAPGFGGMSREALLANLHSLNEGPQACLGPSEAAARAVLRAASNRPGK